MNRFLRIFPWIVIVLALVAAYFFYSANKDKDAELTTLRPQTEEVSQLREESAELKKIGLTIRSDEVAQLKKENLVLLRLRNEVRQMRDEKKQLTIQFHATQTRAQAMQAEIQAQALRTAQQAGGQGQIQIGNYQITPPAQTEQLNACINNLRQIDGAKQQWALENKKTEQDVPTAKDIAPYFKDGVFLKCPAGGVYAINAVNTDPTCSIPGHKLPTP